MFGVAGGGRVGGDAASALLARVEHAKNRDALGGEFVAEFVVAGRQPTHLSGFEAREAFAKTRMCSQLTRAHPRQRNGTLCGSGVQIRQKSG